MHKITQEILKERYYYEDGHLFNRRNFAPMARKGQRAGCLRHNRYIVIRINQKLYLEHRLIFLYHKGELPKEIDHRNNDPSDNHIQNLRKATRAQNNGNQKIRKGCVSDFKGVWLNERLHEDQWVAKIGINGQSKHLGSFPTEELAARAYDAAAIEAYGEFAFTNEMAGLFNKEGEE